MYDYSEMVRQQTITNNKLDTIINNQNAIQTNQQNIIDTIKNASILITMIISIILIYKFIERCFR